jgi:PTH2 family peptidyl-tRNA hydrolase
MSKVKQVIVIRKDLKMRRGKEIAQGSHASMAFLIKQNINPPTLLNPLFLEWLDSGQTKICVSVNSEKELLDIFQQAKNAKLESHIIKDAGRTEFNEPTLTAVAIGPALSKQIDKITGHLPLR